MDTIAAELRVQLVSLHGSHLDIFSLLIQQFYIISLFYLVEIKEYACKLVAGSKK